MGNIKNCQAAAASIFRSVTVYLHLLLALAECNRARIQNNSRKLTGQCRLGRDLQKAGLDSPTTDLDERERRRHLESQLTTRPQWKLVPYFA